MADKFATLEGAARVKQEGNDLYKTGKFEDARRSYNQVLDLLASQTSLTSGEKEKRDNLVLTAHLNLAACELKLGDNAKVIEHCSQALQMEKESIKAYHRRGLAYHNNKDYELALTDYLEAEELEPQNPEVRKQKEKLLTDIMEACTRVADQETLDGASEEEHKSEISRQNSLTGECSPTMEGRDDKVEIAAKIKLEGNDLYKSGKFEDAQRSYNQVLDLLTRQTSLTNGEKEKRDNLLLTAHLNLAACELKLGDNANVIQHCSLALQMDKESVKAFFRRGLAYHNNKDYDLALKDYLEAERLEPQNRQVTKEKEKLQANKIEVCARVADQETLDGDSDEYYHEMVVVYEGDEEADLRDYDKRCQKAARHSEYIPVSQFCLDHLPELYRTDTMLAFMKAMIDSTVLLEVRCSSEKRPVNYPFSGWKYRRAVRTGSGFVQDVDIYPKHGNKVCPCDECQMSRKPKTQFAEIEIGTAEHVVFDLREAGKTNCYFYFDDDQTDRRSCQCLKGGVDVKKYGGDYCRVYFVTHDLQFADNLEKAFVTLHNLRPQLRSDMGIITHDEAVEKMELSEKFSNLHEKFQETLQKYRQPIDRLKTITKDNALQLLLESVQKHGQGGDPWYQEILSDALVGGDWCDGVASGLCSIYEEIKADNDKLEHVKDSFEATLDQYGYKYMQDRYRADRDYLRSITRLWCVLDVPGNGAVPGTSNELKCYDSSHPFIVIVSHPHGLGKKISLGIVTERTAVLGYNHIRYQYTNTTCPGSSGAPVFIMGRLGAAMCYPHSKNVRRQLQINQSALSSDV